MNSFQMHSRTAAGLQQISRSLAEAVRQQLLYDHDDISVLVQTHVLNSTPLDPPIANKVRFVLEVQVTTLDEKLQQERDKEEALEQEETPAE